MTDPDSDELQRLHTALCDGDTTAAPRLAMLLLPALRRRFRNAAAVDPHQIESLINLSIAQYVKNPWRYDPGKGPLLAFLYRDVDGDRKNELASLQGRREHETPSDTVIDISASGRNPGVEEEVLDALDPFDVPADLLEVARGELAQLSDLDRRLLAMIADRVRATAAYAEVLGISHLPKRMQAREVKRHKDRLKARLEVIRGRLRS